MGFVTCRQLSSPTQFLIITRVHVMAVQLPNLATSRWTPTLIWAAALGDLEHCKKRSNSNDENLGLLVMQPEMSLLESQQHLAQQALGLRLPPRSPWRLHTATFLASPAASFAQRILAACTLNYSYSLHCVIGLHRQSKLGQIT